MRIDLKSKEYYDYYDIKRVEIIDSIIVKITGNFEKGTKSKTAQLYLQSIKNIREFNRFLKNEMKRFDAEGKCPKCDSLSIEERGQAVYYRKVNEPKAKTIYEDNIFGNFTCKSCGNQCCDLKPIDLVIYYK